MRVYQVDPTKDARWSEFVEQHPKASVFHTVGWLQALRRTYGYEPVVFTTSPPNDELKNGLVFCCVRSWLTGQRIVSLPFSDHCEPLFDSKEEVEFILSHLKTNLKAYHWKYLELRPFFNGPRDARFENGLQPIKSYYLHKLDLKPNLHEVFSGFQKDSIQRKIRRAEREGLTYEEGRSETLLRKFYQLMLITRRRHELPPPPFKWFRNLADCMADKLAIRVASQHQRPVAAMAILSHNDEVVYKYGCSNAQFHNLGGMPFLFWKTVEAAKKAGAGQLDLGRSEIDNHGLIQFKERLGATRSMLTYVKFPADDPQSADARWKMQIAKQVFSHLPGPCLAAAGRLLYRHVG